MEHDRREAHRGVTRGHGDTLAGQPPRPTSPVPPFEKVRQRAPDLLLEAQPSGHAFGDLAVGPLSLRHWPLPTDQGAGPHNQTAKRPLGRRDAGDQRQHLTRARRVGQVASAPDVDIVAAKVGRVFVRAGCAADEAQKGRVVDVGTLSLGQRHLPGQPGRQQRGRSRLLGRLAASQVGRHGEGDEDVSQPQPGRLLFAAFHPLGD